MLVREPESKTPKGDQSGHGSTFTWPVKETETLQSSSISQQGEETAVSCLSFISSQLRNGKYRGLSLLKGCHSKDIQFAIILFSGEKVQGTATGLKCVASSILGKTQWQIY